MSENIQTKKHRLSKKILHWLLLLLVIVVLAVLATSILHLVKKRGHLVLELNDISRIQSLEAAGYRTQYVKTGTDNTVNLSFSGSAILKAEGIIVYLEDGTMDITNAVFFQPHDKREHILEIEPGFLADMHYSIDTTVFPPTDLPISAERYSLKNELCYTAYTGNDYEYSITSTRMKVDLYWPFLQDQRYLCVNLKNCGVYYVDTNNRALWIRSCFYLPVTSVSYGSASSSFCLYAKSPSDKLYFEVVEHSNYGRNINQEFFIQVFYPDTFDGFVTGMLDWSYGQDQDKKECKNSNLCFSVDNRTLYQRDYTIIFPFGISTGKTLVLPEETLFPSMELISIKDETGRTMSMSFNGYVVKVYHDDYSLFPNIWSWITENWKDVGRIEISMPEDSKD